MALKLIGNAARATRVGAKYWTTCGRVGCDKIAVAALAFSWWDAIAHCAPRTLDQRASVKCCTVDHGVDLRADDPEHGGDGFCDSPKGDHGSDTERLLKFKA